MRNNFCLLNHQKFCLLPEEKVGLPNVPRGRKEGAELGNSAASCAPVNMVQHREHPRVRVSETGSGPAHQPSKLRFKPGLNWTYMSIFSAAVATFPPLVEVIPPGYAAEKLHLPVSFLGNDPKHLEEPTEGPMLKCSVDAETCGANIPIRFVIHIDSDIDIY